MVERNPYETNTPVDVPSFMKEDKDDKDKVNMNYFKMPEDEINEDDYDEEEEDERPVRRSNGNSTHTLLVVLTVISIVVAIVSLVLFVSKNSAYNSLKAEYDKQVETSENTIDRLEKQVESLTKENDTLKAEAEASKTSDTTSTDSKSSDSSSTTTTTTTTVGSFKTGTYKVVSSMKVRSGAGTDFDVVDHEVPPMTQWLWENTYTGSSMVENVNVTVSEIKTNGDQVWGKVADGCWICLQSGSNTYVSFVK